MTLKVMKPELPPTVRLALDELKAALREVYGDRLRGIYLYGSYARGTAHRESDIDVLIVLEGPVKPGAEISRINDVVSKICLRHDLLISTLPVSADSFGARDTYFVQKVGREAVAL